jgi:tRNA pseudouridine38-40 synthase
VRSFRLVLEYDGAGFAGWQRQPAQRTVQGALEDALARLAGEPVRVRGASRTDAGVHAEGQVVCARLATDLAPDALRRALNGLLPRDAAVVDAAEAPAGYDPRRAARAKLYRYRIWNGASPSPLRAARTHRAFTPLDLAAMREAAAHLLGEHDFRAFQAAGAAPGPTVRTLHRLAIEGESRGEVRLLVEGDGFLRHMVRILAGTLVEVGIGRRAPAGLPARLAARERAAAGPTAPARGLCLVWVDDGFPLARPGLPRAEP